MPTPLVNLFRTTETLCAADKRAIVKPHEPPKAAAPIRMIEGSVSLLCLPGEGRDPGLPWAPAFAGVTEFW
jgi:hypothetical protein